MILGIGIDITDIQKIEESIRHESFRRKVFTSAERNAAEKFQNQSEHLAGKFAAKEAFMKAIGAGIWQEIGFAQIEVLNDESGKPYLRLSGKAKARLQQIEAKQVHVSISHSAGVAVAVVILDS